MFIWNSVGASERLKEVFVIFFLRIYHLIKVSRNAVESLDTFHLSCCDACMPFYFLSKNFGTWFVRLKAGLKTMT